MNRFIILRISEDEGIIAFGPFSDLESFEFMDRLVEKCRLELLSEGGINQPEIERDDEGGASISVGGEVVYDFNKLELEAI